MRSALSFAQLAGLLLAFLFVMLYELACALVYVASASVHCMCTRACAPLQRCAVPSVWCVLACLRACMRACVRVPVMGERQAPSFSAPQREPSAAVESQADAHGQKMETAQRVRARARGWRMESACVHGTVLLAVIAGI
jgi:hypothetical protein